MLSEGVHIYAMVIRVYNTGRVAKKHYYYFIGWGKSLFTFGWLAYFYQVLKKIETYAPRKPPFEMEVM